MRAGCMSLIQIRNVPDDVHRTLKARAALAGTSLSDYLLREITRVALAPSPEELDARIRARTPVEVTTDENLTARDAGRRV
jgi:plasmid stability protein